MGIKCTFLHSGSYDIAVLENIAQGGGMHVVYLCVETLETPAIAQVLYSDSFRAQLSGTYIDEAHSLHESLSWRPGYSRIYVLRRVIGMDAPLVAISATLPGPYRNSLVHYAGLRSDYHLINLGNFRPELSTIIKHMQHPVNSFLDLTFVIPFNATAENLQQTIIYSDDLDILTAMYWWGRARLASLGLPEGLIDIIHAGLSEEHQVISTDDFMKGRSKILLGSDKIGAGMDFPHVTLVVQYRCRGLTIVKWEQRRGRGGRRDGMTAVGVILVESSMTGSDKDSPTVKNPKSEDPGIVELVQSVGPPNCSEKIVDKHLDNPPRPDSESHFSSLCGRCSSCDPDLRVAAQFTFIMEEVNPHKAAPRGAISDVQKKKIFDELVIWRSKLWRAEWKDKWPSYGPDCLVTDHDLREITQRAQGITTIDDLDNIAQIPHLDELAHSLLSALQSILQQVCGIEPRDPLVHSESAQAPAIQPESTFRSINWAEPEFPSTIEAAEARGEPIRKQGNLSQGEFILSFS